MRLPCLLLLLSPCVMGRYPREKEHDRGLEAETGYKMDSLPLHQHPHHSSSSSSSSSYEAPLVSVPIPVPVPVPVPVSAVPEFLRHDSKDSYSSFSFHNNLNLPLSVPPNDFSPNLPPNFPGKVSYFYSPTEQLIYQVVRIPLTRPSSPSFIDPMNDPLSDPLSGPLSGHLSDPLSDPSTGSKDEVDLGYDDALTSLEKESNSLLFQLLRSESEREKEEMMELSPSPLPPTTLPTTSSVSSTQQETIEPSPTPLPTTSPSHGHHSHQALGLQEHNEKVKSLYENSDGEGNRGRDRERGNGEDTDATEFYGAFGTKVPHNSH